MTDILALATLVLWPVIPLFWIPVHYATGLFRKLGLFTYLLPSITWLPVAYLIYQYRGILLQQKMVLPGLVNICGIILLIFGTSLHIWTAILLGSLGIIGVPEVSSIRKNNLMDQGPFSVIRHPTYLAHTIIFAGVFLITGSIMVGLLTVLDLVVVHTIIIPLEEKELSRRFGAAYELYKKNVPARFFPSVHR